jgi:hypothetical protein
MEQSSALSLVSVTAFQVTTMLADQRNSRVGVAVVINARLNAGLSQNRRLVPDINASAPLRTCVREEARRPATHNAKVRKTCRHQ